MSAEFVGATTQRHPDGYYPTETSCWHSQALNSYTGLVTTNPGGVQYDYKDYKRAGTSFAQVEFMEVLSKVPTMSYDFSSNNDFELITLLADLDGTLGMFTLDFWKKLSKAGFSDKYNTFSYGVLPFIADLKALQASLGDLFGGGIQAGIEKLHRLKTSRQKFTLDYDNGFERVHLDGTLVFKGQWSQNGGPPDSKDFLPILIDELGIHPDLGTVWDVIPLSFVVDYFIPVGGFIDSIHPRGWFKPTFTFSGYVSCSWKSSSHWGTNFIATPDTPLELKQFVRNHLWNGNVPSSRPKLPDWKAPSAKELFNTAMLSRAISGVFGR